MVTILGLSHTTTLIAMYCIGLQQFDYITRHKTQKLWHIGLRNVCRVSLTIVEVIGYRTVLLIRCWSVLDRDRGYTNSCMRWLQEQDAEWTIRIDIKQPALHRFGLFNNLHLIYMQVWSIPEQEMADCYVTPWV